jgi:hypothetical protein
MRSKIVVENKCSVKLNIYAQKDTKIIPIPSNVDEHWWTSEIDGRSFSFSILNSQDTLELDFSQAYGGSAGPIDCM